MVQKVIDWTVGVTYSMLLLRIRLGKCSRPQRVPADCGGRQGLTSMSSEGLSADDLAELLRASRLPIALAVAPFHCIGVSLDKVAIGMCTLASIEDFVLGRISLS